MARPRSALPNVQYTLPSEDRKALSVIKESSDLYRGWDFPTAARAIISDCIRDKAKIVTTEIKKSPLRNSPFLYWSLEEIFQVESKVLQVC